MDDHATRECGWSRRRTKKEKKEKKEKWCLPIYIAGVCGEREKASRLGDSVYCYTELPGHIGGGFNNATSEVAW